MNLSTAAGSSGRHTLPIHHHHAIQHHIFHHPYHQPHHLPSSEVYSLRLHDKSYQNGAELLLSQETFGSEFKAGDLVHLSLAHHPTNAVNVSSILNYGTVDYSSPSVLGHGTMSMGGGTPLLPNRLSSAVMPSKGGFVKSKLATVASSNSLSNMVSTPAASAALLPPLNLAAASVSGPSPRPSRFGATGSGVVPSANQRSLVNSPGIHSPIMRTPQEHGGSHMNSELKGMALAKSSYANPNATDNSTNLPHALTSNRPDTNAADGSSRRMFKDGDNTMKKLRSDTSRNFFGPSPSSAAPSNPMRQVTTTHDENSPHLKHHNKDLVLQVVFLASTGAKSAVQISLLNSVAELFGFTSYSLVAIRKVQEEHVRLDFMELTFMDQYVSSSEMWRLKLLLSSSAVHLRKAVSNGHIFAQVNELVSAGRKVSSGYITHDTKLTFRSLSSKMIWLVQLSREMWYFSSSGRLYFELLLDFLHSIFSKWAAVGVNHQVSVVFFARIFYENKEPLRASSSQTHVRRPSGGLPSSIFAHTFQKYSPVSPSTSSLSAANLPYRDYYEVVIDSQRALDICKNQNTHALLREMKRSFFSFASRVGWNVFEDVYASEPSWQSSWADMQESKEQASKVVQRVASQFLNTPIIPSRHTFGINSTAQSGNLLEAINMALDQLGNVFYDRSLKVTGKTIVVFHAGPGTMNVSRDLAKISKLRMMESGISCDLISVATPSNHVVPLFIYHDTELSGSPPSNQPSSPTIQLGTIDEHQKRLATSLHKSSAPTSLSSLKIGSSNSASNLQAQGRLAAVSSHSAHGASNVMKGSIHNPDSTMASKISPLYEHELRGRVQKMSHHNSAILAPTPSQLGRLAVSNSSHRFRKRYSVPSHWLHLRFVGPADSGTGSFSLTNNSDLHDSSLVFSLNHSSRMKPKSIQDVGAFMEGRFTTNLSWAQGFVAMAQYDAMLFATPEYKYGGSTNTSLHGSVHGSNHGMPQYVSVHGVPGSSTLHDSVHGSTQLFRRSAEAAGMFRTHSEDDKLNLTEEYRLIPKVHTKALKTSSDVGISRKSDESFEKQEDSATAANRAVADPTNFGSMNVRDPARAPEEPQPSEENTPRLSVSSSGVAQISPLAFVLHRNRDEADKMSKKDDGVSRSNHAYSASSSSSSNSNTNTITPRALSGPSHPNGAGSPTKSALLGPSNPSGPAVGATVPNPTSAKRPISFWASPSKAVGFQNPGKPSAITSNRSESNLNRMSAAEEGLQRRFSSKSNIDLVLLQSKMKTSRSLRSLTTSMSSPRMAHPLVDGASSASGSGSVSGGVGTSAAGTKVKETSNPLKSASLFDFSLDPRRGSSHRRRWAHAVPNWDLQSYFRDMDRAFAERGAAPYLSALEDRLLAAIVNDRKASYRDSRFHHWRTNEPIGSLNMSTLAIPPTANGSSLVSIDQMTGVDQDNFIKSLAVLSSLEQDMSRLWMWKSLVEPAVLPLTTDYAPDVTFLHQDAFLQYVHTLPLPQSQDGVYGDVTRSILKELVCQRMIMDFQVVVGSSDELFVKNLESRELFEKSLRRADQYKFGSGRVGASTSRSASSVSGTTRCLLTRGREYHELLLRPENLSVEVRRYVQRDKTNGVGVHAANLNVSYQYALWNNALGCFLDRRVNFNASPSEIKWNNLDQLLVSGYRAYGDLESSDLDSFACRRIRFVILPKLTPPTLAHQEAKRAKGKFMEFMSAFHRFNNWLKSKEQEKDPSAFLLYGSAPDDIIPYMWYSGDRDLDHMKNRFDDENDDELRRKRAAQARIDRMTGKLNREKLNIVTSSQRHTLANMDPNVYWAKSEKPKTMTKLDMNQYRGQDNEWLMVIHDIVYHPELCFHFDLVWIACSGSTVNDYVETCIRKARQFGFTMVQIPRCFSVLEPYTCQSYFSIQLKHGLLQARAISKHLVMDEDKGGYGFCVLSVWNDHLSLIHKSTAASILIRPYQEPGHDTLLHPEKETIIRGDADLMAIQKEDESNIFEGAAGFNAQFADGQTKKSRAFNVGFPCLFSDKRKFEVLTYASTLANPDQPSYIESMRNVIHLIEKTNLLQDCVKMWVEDAIEAALFGL